MTHQFSNILPHFKILAAVAANRVIGLNNSLPWYLPEDLKHFKQLTTGHIIVMGRHTFESIGKPLPNRTNVVLSHQHNLNIPGVFVVNSIPEMVERFATEDRSIFIIGGANLYRQTFALCQRMYLTEIQQDFAGDTFFPEYNHDEWQEISREIHHQVNGSNLEYHFVVLERKQV